MMEQEPAHRQKGANNQNVDGTFRQLMKEIRNFLKSLIDLETGLDMEGTVVSIKNNNKTKGSNAWLLMCSIVIASLGLDLSSPAIIIGAMLISPLMSPILGIGLAIAINDREVLGISFRSFIISVVIALLTSYLYFLLNPTGSQSPTPEILSRTQPTILDAMVAAFGGLAGIISISRKEQSSALPGVAIATALMPPLCVAGYGLAQQQFLIFLNAFYLFFLNSFFIAVSTFIMIRYMGFPIRRFVNRKEELRTRFLVIFLSFLITIPSGYILYNVYQENLANRKIQSFVNEYFGPEQDPRYIDYEVIEGDTSTILLLNVIGKAVSQDSIRNYESIARSNGIQNAKLFLIQDATVGLGMVKQLEKQVTGYGNLIEQLEALENERTAAEIREQKLASKMDSLSRDTVPLSAILMETKAVFDYVDELSFSSSIQKNGGRRGIPTFLVKWKGNTPSTSKRKERTKLENYLRLRTKKDSLQVLDLD